MKCTEHPKRLPDPHQVETLLSGSRFSVAALHVVGRQHPGLPGSLHSAVHPALIDGLSVDDDIAVPEGHLVVVLSCVVVERSVNALKHKWSLIELKEFKSLLQQEQNCVGLWE